MSGGRFDYAQNRISDIYTEIEDYIDGHPLDEEDERCFLEDRWLEEDEDKYVESIIIRCLTSMAYLKRLSRNSKRVLNF